MICKHCGHEFFGKPGYTRYCSDECVNAARRKPCVVCGRSMIPYKQRHCVACWKRTHPQPNDHGTRMPTAERLQINIDRVVAKALAAETCPPDALEQTGNIAGRILKAKRVG